MSQYATAAEFDVYGILPLARPASIDSTKINAALIAASGRADSYLKSRFQTPITSWGVDLTQVVCAIAAFELISTTLLFNPESNENKTMTARFDSAIRWLEQVSAGRATPTNIVDSDPSAAPGGPASAARAFGNTRRGW